MAGLFTNYPAIWKVLSYHGGGTLSITGERHYLVEPAYGFLATRLTNRDVLLTDILYRYDEISQQLFHPLETISFYQLVFSQDVEPLSVIDEYPRGWIAVSGNARPVEFGLQPADFVYDGTYVKYFGTQGEIYLWQWGERAP
jgi:hypothetical protein